MEESLLAFRVTSAKPFLLKIQYSKPSKIIEIYALHIPVFANMTNIIVQSYAGQHMCMEVIICQSERYLEIVMISETHTIGGHQITLDGSRNMDKALPPFGVTSVKPFSPKKDNWNLPKLWKFGHSKCIY